MLRGAKVVMDVKTMEVKKAQQLSKSVIVSDSGTKEAVQKTEQWKEFLGNIKTEFNKISWTSPDELRTYTKIVVGMTFFLGMGIYVMDLGIQLVLNTLGFLIHLIGG